MAGIILAIGLLVFLAHFFTAVFQRTRIPDVLLLMGLGILLGPVGHIVQPADFGQVGRVMSTLALIVILFEGGIALDPPVLRRAIRPTLWLTFPTLIATVLATYFTAVYLLHVPPMTAWMAGAILGGVSAAVVIPLVKSMQMREPLGTALVMESALGDVLCIVLLLGLVEAAAAGSLNPAKMVGSIFASLVMAAAIGLAGGVAWLLVLNKVRQFPNTAFTTLAMVFILYGVADELGFSGAIAALAFGAMLTNYDAMGLRKIPAFHERDLGKIEQQDVSFFMEILFLLKTFFFVYLGVSIRFQNLELAAWAGILCAIVYAARLVIVRLTIFQENVSWKDLAFSSLMVPKGLVAAVLAGIPVERGVEGAGLVRDFTNMVVLFSICLTAIVIPLADRGPIGAIYRAIFGGKERIDDGSAAPAPARH